MGTSIPVTETVIHKIKEKKKIIIARSKIMWVDPKSTFVKVFKSLL